MLVSPGRGFVCTYVAVLYLEYNKLSVVGNTTLVADLATTFAVSIMRRRYLLAQAAGVSTAQLMSFVRDHWLWGSSDIPFPMLGVRCQRCSVRGSSTYVVGRTYAMSVAKQAPVRPFGNSYTEAHKLTVLSQCRLPSLSQVVPSSTCGTSIQRLSEGFGFEQSEGGRSADCFWASFAMRSRTSTLSGPNVHTSQHRSHSRMDQEEETATIIAVQVCALLQRYQKSGLESVDSLPVPLSPATPTLDPQIFQSSRTSGRIRRS